MEKSNVSLENLLDQLSEEKINLLVDRTALRAGWDTEPPPAGSGSGSGSGKSHKSKKTKKHHSGKSGNSGCFCTCG